MVSYRSTRGDVTGATFEEVVLGGLAPDRGLYVPETIPTFTPQQIQAMADLSFEQLAMTIMSKFISTDEVPSADLERLIKASTVNFRDKNVTPVVKTGEYWTLELFHGPTFAFKDVALQFLGNLFEFFISRKEGSDKRLTILGATSGDTGSAAIYGLRGKQHVDCFITYPKGRVSLIQEQQMSTVPDANIHCLRVEGTFDDCQDLVKAAFMDVRFRDEVKLGAVNSINWARVLAQITYYFYAYFQVVKGRKFWHWGDGLVNFSVPTGNFGDILAGYYAKQMGLPIGKLIVGTNENDILARFFSSGEYDKRPIAASLSPSMDICVSSNFERYLFHLFGCDPAALRELMEAFESKPGTPKVSNKIGWAEPGKLAVNNEVLARATSGDGFLAARADSKEVLECIAETYKKEKYLFCPHSAVGVVAAKKLGQLGHSTVCLATAHPGKFYDNVKKAVDPLPPLPPALAAVQTLPMRMTDLPNSSSAVQSHVLGNMTGGQGASKTFAGLPLVAFVPLAAVLGLMWYSA